MSIGLTLLIVAAVVAAFAIAITLIFRAEMAKADAPQSVHLGDGHHSAGTGCDSYLGSDACGGGGD